jgi:hypothetical protein
MTSQRIWFDASSSSNKLRRSYVNGFLDISGGSVYLRADNSMNFYTKADGLYPKLAITASKIRVVDPANASNLVDISTTTLAYISTLSENVQNAITDVRNTVTNVTGLSTQSAYVTNDLSVNGRLILTGDASLNSRLSLGSNAFLNARTAAMGFLRATDELKSKMYKNKNFFSGSP